MSVHAQYEDSISYGSKVMAKVKYLRLLGLRSRLRSLRLKWRYDQKDLITRNAHVKYESPVYNESKVMVKVQFF